MAYSADSQAAGATQTGAAEPRLTLCSCGGNKTMSRLLDRLSAWLARTFPNRCRGCHRSHGEHGCVLSAAAQWCSECGKGQREPNPKQGRILVDPNYRPPMDGIEQRGRE